MDLILEYKMSMSRDAERCGGYYVASKRTEVKRPPAVGTSAGAYAEPHVWQSKIDEL